MTIQWLSWLDREKLHFIGRELWLPNSLDLNPVDYKIWGHMRENICHTVVQEVNYLKQYLIDMWSGCRPLNQWLMGLYI